MELSFNELKKRDVINVADGKCLGHITDLRLCFPEGILVGISVPGRKTKGIFRFFDRSETFIEVGKIIKIGGDVILVDMRRSASCLPHSKDNKPHQNRPCTPPCPPPPPPPRPEPRRYGAEETMDLSGLFNGDNGGNNGRIDLDDY